MSVPPTAGLEAGEAPGGDGVPEPRPKRQVLGWEPIVRQGDKLAFFSELFSGQKEIEFLIPTAWVLAMAPLGTDS